MLAYEFGMFLLKKKVKLEKLAIENGLILTNLFKMIGIIQGKSYKEISKGYKVQQTNYWSMGKDV